MTEFGVFKDMTGIWTGVLLDDHRVQPVLDPTAAVPQANPQAEIRPWSELVVLPPARPTTCALVQIVQGKIGGVRLKAPSAVSPHRAMAAIAYADHETRVLPVLAFRIGGSVARTRSTDNVWGTHLVAATLGLHLWDVTLQQQDATDSRFDGFPTYLPLGPTWRTTETLPTGTVQLRHNGACKEICAATVLLELAAAALAAATDAFRLETGDLLCLCPEGAGEILQPGDHLEARCGGLRPLAVNLGMRGSA
jgi:hypothetical protein